LHLLSQFRKLSELETAEAGAICDVIGIVESVADWSVITRKDGTDTKKRSLNLRDDSGRSIEVCGDCERGIGQSPRMHMQQFCTSRCILAQASA